MSFSAWLVSLVAGVILGALAATVFDLTPVQAGVAAFCLGTVVAIGIEAVVNP
jgi:hypothetical protein